MNIESFLLGIAVGILIHSCLSYLLFCSRIDKQEYRQNHTTNAGLTKEPKKDEETVKDNTKL